MKTLLTADELQAGVQRIASQIHDHYQGRPLTIIGILTGSVILLADLIRLLEMPLRVGVLQARSYRGATTTRSELEIYDELIPDITHREVLLVDDIFDTGHTLSLVSRRIQNLGPRSVQSLVLLRKQGRQEVDLEPDFVGFEIPDQFVVGYGLDYHDEYRNLPYVAALEEHDLR
ncbi:MAG: hypoxanthine phosphoribosyltransferase [Planctomycetales bacterium]|nr:hypoxanthine phosphoribosyltransferase [Planctomycetales bacterium]